MRINITVSKHPFWFSYCWCCAGTPWGQSVACLVDIQASPGVSGPKLILTDGVDGGLHMDLLINNLPSACDLSVEHVKHNWVWRPSQTQCSNMVRRLAVRKLLGSPGEGEGQLAPPRSSLRVTGLGILAADCRHRADWKALCRNDWNDWLISGNRTEHSVLGFD